MNDEQKLDLIILLARDALEFHDKKDAFAAVLGDILTIAEYREESE